MVQKSNKNFIDKITNRLLTVTLSVFLFVLALRMNKTLTSIWWNNEVKLI